ncbi:MAG: dehydrogenase, partial [Sphingobacteriales bacterium]
TVPGHRQAGMVGRFDVVEGPITNEPTVKGKVPTKDGKPLNLNFEAGTLKDWTAMGTAFTVASVISEDPSPVHEKDMHIGFAGKHFVTSGGTKNYKLTGSLTSVPFKVTQPFAAFRVSGGALVDTRVEIVEAANDSVYFHITGQGRATLQPVVVNLTSLVGKEIYIRLVDKETGISQIPYIGDDIWAHISFDDFLFYPSRPDFTNELLQKDIVILPPLDVVKFAGLSGIEAAKAMTVPNGFKVTLAASEPEIIRPIAFTIDWRGRIWVAEAHTYPVRAPEGQGKDRILILEDTNGDGTLDKKTIFIEGLNLVSGIEVGMGGLYVGAAPYFMFIPIDDKTDKPAGPTQILLDGFGLEDTHETLNNFRWGPDGWLYGTHGVFTQSNVGKPGTPNDQRVRLNAGLWRFHPTTQKFEIFSEGTSNPWGVDFNDYGQSFLTVCVIPHMFQAVQGARYLRQYGESFNPYTYDIIQPIGDHVHYVGDRGPHAGNFRSASKGGGHAHAGAMIYLGGDTWPAEYHDKIFMNNIHGARTNMDILTRNGSGYVGSHGADFLLANDTWSQWLNLRYDASGSVFAIDWYDKNQCHSPNPDVHNKTMGRIFKISNENDKWVKVDLSKASDKELVDYQLNHNEWYVRWARTILQQRGPNKKVHKALKKILKENPDPTRKLRALWALHVTKGLNEKELLNELNEENEYVRAWAIQLLAEDENLSDNALKRFAELAVSDKSVLVRMYLTSAMLRTDPAKRWTVLEALYQHAEDKDDHNMPLMLWYAIEPVVPINTNAVIDLAFKTQIPRLLPYTIKRIAALDTPESKATLQVINDRINKSTNPHQYHESMMLLEKLLAKK